MIITIKKKRYVENSTTCCSAKMRRKILDHKAIFLRTISLISSGENIASTPPITMLIISAWDRPHSRASEACSEEGRERDKERGKELAWYVRNSTSDISGGCPTILWRVNIEMSIVMHFSLKTQLLRKRKRQKVKNPPARKTMAWHAEKQRCYQNRCVEALLNWETHTHAHTTDKARDSLLT